MYVSAPQVFLRDRVAQVYNKTGTVKNGDRVDVLDRDRRFVKVRTATGVEGWIEQRFLIGQPIFDAFARAQDRSPERSRAVDRDHAQRYQPARHARPRDRSSLSAYDRDQGCRTRARNCAEAGSSRASAEEGAGCGWPAATCARRLVARPRRSAARVGWVLARMIDLDVPLEIAQYAEGQRFIGFYALNQVQDGDKKVPQYLAASPNPKMVCLTISIRYASSPGTSASTATKLLIASTASMASCQSRSPTKILAKKANCRYSSCT